ncbi:MAG: DUF1552 domain-containing protein [Lentisphaeraceae bacterium]|nr:DUF1552 domain-containing protein [Lentisphaeraceae bacterium]
MKKQSFWIRPKAISRRTALKAAGVSLALPFLESMAASGKAPENPDRMIAVMCEMGYITDYLFPKKDGRNYEMTDYLKQIEEFRDDFTVFSGMSLAGVNGGHDASRSFLSGAVNPSSSSFKNSISLDQFMAQKIGHLTRFSNLPLSLTENTSKFSILQSGVTLPSINRASELYKMMFIQGTKADVAKQLTNLNHGKSILDMVNGEAKKFATQVTKNDKVKLDQYMTSVREAEKRLNFRIDWAKTPKPGVKHKIPKDVTDKTDVGTKLRQMYEMVSLAFETDSTRLVTIYAEGGGFGNLYSLKDTKVTDGWHPLTHMAGRKDKRPILKKIDEDQYKALGSFMKLLKTKKSGGESLLDKTMILHSSNLGHAGRHDNYNLPTILAGGKFKHGQHLAFDRKNNYNQANLYLSMLHSMGMNVNKFASSTETLKGLDMI